LASFHAESRSSRGCHTLEELTVGHRRHSRPGVWRRILFDKTPEANGKIIWHQDLTIAVIACHRMKAPSSSPFFSMGQAQPAAATIGPWRDGIVALLPAIIPF
jgi:hypothetical protein